jgi:HD-GYP domain-containing protein (c-di-GMP phosphodiesterase class II)
MSSPSPRAHNERQIPIAIAPVDPGETARWRRLLETQLRDGTKVLLRTVRGMTVENDQDVEALLDVVLGGREAFGHAQRVRLLAMATARALDLPEDDAAVLGRAALIHDIGKAALPPALVRKPAALTADELALVRTYPAIGASALSEIPFLKTAAPLVRDAHERVDGLGFPHAVCAESVSLSARILGVADAYDVMTHPCVYRDAMSCTRALLELERCSGSQFDASVVHAFRGIIPR